MPSRRVDGSFSCEYWLHMCLVILETDVYLRPSCAAKDTFASGYYPRLFTQLQLYNLAPFYRCTSDRINSNILGMVFLYEVTLIAGPPYFVIPKPPGPMFYTDSSTHHIAAIARRYTTTDNGFASPRILKSLGSESYSP